MKKFPNKKHTPILLGIAAFIAIVVNMFIANFKTMIKTELKPPADGVIMLTTVSEQLVVVSKTNEMHVRDWSNITEKPLRKLNQAGKVALMADSKLLRIPFGKPGTVEIEHLGGNRNLLTIPPLINYI